MGLFFKTSLLHVLTYFHYKLFHILIIGFLNASCAPPRTELLSFREMVILLNLSKSCKVSAYKVWPSPSFLMSIRAWQELNWSPQKLVGLNESRFFWLRVLSTKWNEDPYLFVKTIAFDFIGNYLCISNPKYQLHKDSESYMPFSFFNFHLSHLSHSSNL